MSKKYDFLFIGPQASGKTTICSHLAGEHIPECYEETNNRSNKTFKIKGTGFLGMRKDVAIDTGGMPSQENSYKDWIIEAKRVVFVFDGTEFLEELRNFREGGETSMKISNSVLKKVYEKFNLKTSNLFFVATHNDVFKQKFPDKDMKKEIFDSIKIANDEYKKIAHTDRYKFLNVLTGRLFTINALDEKEVQYVFNQIKNEKL